MQTWERRESVGSWRRGSKEANVVPTWKSCVECSARPLVACGRISTAADEVIVMLGTWMDPSGTVLR